MNCGDIVCAQLVEKFGNSSFIISIEGKLIRVKNHSYKIFNVGDEVCLRVTSELPLRLQLMGAQSSSTLDRNI